MTTVRYGAAKPEVVRVAGLHNPAPCFDRDGDGMGVREQCGANARLGQQRSDEPRQAPVRVAQRKGGACSVMLPCSILWVGP
jgi:hypothetical protein